MSQEKPQIPLVYRILGLIGALLWAGTILLREVLPREAPGFVRFLLGVMPNFACVWTAQGLFVSLAPQLLRRLPTRRERDLSLAAILLILLVAEALHPLTGGSPFDVWDMLASVIAALPLFLYNRFDKTMSA